MIGMSPFFYLCSDVDLFTMQVAAKRLNGFVKVILKGIIFFFKIKIKIKIILTY